jgi:hypothetical protein
VLDASQVRFTCCAASDGALASVAQFQEPTLCSYVVTVCTPLVCPQGGLSADAALAPYKGVCFAITVPRHTHALTLSNKHVHLNFQRCT